MYNAKTKYLWIILTDSYHKEQIQSKLNMQTQFYSVSYKDNRNLQEHFTTLEEIFLELARLDEPVSVGKKTSNLLTSLSSSH